MENVTFCAVAVPKSGKYHTKTIVPDFRCDKIAGLHPVKQEISWAFSCEFCKIFQNSFFAEYLRTAAVSFSHPVFP